MILRARTSHDDDVTFHGSITLAAAAELTAIVCEAAAKRRGEPAGDGFVSFACDPSNLYEGIDHEGFPLEAGDEAVLRKIRGLLDPREPDDPCEGGIVVGHPVKAAYVELSPEPSATLRAAAERRLPSRLDALEAATGHRIVAKTPG